jgi:hypothetical protein
MEDDCHHGLVESTINAKEAMDAVFGTMQNKRSKHENPYYNQKTTSVQAFQEYQQMQQLLQHIQISDDRRDVWKYIWGNLNYTTSRFYHLPYKHTRPPQPFVWLWNSRCSNKLKVFSWLLLIDRLNVRNILRRKQKIKLEGSNYNCVHCSHSREKTTFHLFFSCPYSRVLEPSKL